MITLQALYIKETQRREEIWADACTCSVPLASVGQQALLDGDASHTSSCKSNWQEGAQIKAILWHLYGCNFWWLLHVCSEQQDGWVSEAVKCLAMRDVNHRLTKKSSGVKRCQKWTRQLLNQKQHHVWALFVLGVPEGERERGDEAQAQWSAFHKELYWEITDL